MLKRHIFGRKSEKIPAALLGAESDLFGVPAQDPSLGQTKQVAAHERTVKPTGHGRVALPDDLPCETTGLDVPGRRRPVRAAASSAFISEMMSASSWTSCRRGLLVFASCAPRWPAGNAECGVAQAKPPVKRHRQGHPHRQSGELDHPVEICRPSSAAPHRRPVQALGWRSL
ncbi:MAG: transposase [Fibrobacteres bacterium]|nr:transposase [Fibrobacterota bacterium]